MGHKLSAPQLPRPGRGPVGGRQLQADSLSADCRQTRHLRCISLRCRCACHEEEKLGRGRPCRAPGGSQGGQ